MKKIVYYTMSISLGLLVLIFIEGMMTLGSAFNFESYSVFGWIVQAILVVFTISLSAMIAEAEDK
jgi:hypothetical protein